MLWNWWKARSTVTMTNTVDLDSDSATKPGRLGTELLADVGNDKGLVAVVFGGVAIYTTNVQVK